MAFSWSATHDPRSLSDRPRPTACRVEWLDEQPTGDTVPLTEPCAPDRQCEVIRRSLPARYACPVCPWKPADD